MKNSYKLDSSFKIETKYSIGKSRCQYFDEKISTIKKLYTYVTNKNRVGSHNRDSKNAPEKESKGTKMKYEIVGSKFYSLVLRQYRIILSADTASEVQQLLSQKRR